MESIIESSSGFGDKTLCPNIPPYTSENRSLGDEWSDCLDSCHGQSPALNGPHAAEPPADHFQESSSQASEDDQLGAEASQGAIAHNQLPLGDKVDFTIRDRGRMRRMPVKVGVILAQSCLYLSRLYRPTGTR